MNIESSCEPQCTSWNKGLIRQVLSLLFKNHAESLFSTKAIRFQLFFSETIICDIFIGHSFS